MIKNFEDLVALNKDFAVAVSASANAAAAGSEAIAKTYASVTKSAMERFLATVDKLGAVKTPEDAIKLPTKLALENFNATMADTKDVVELANKIGSDVAAPLAAHAKTAFNQAKKAA